MSQRILLTGGSGFVGRRMALALEARFPEARRLAIYRDADSSHLDKWEASHTDLTDALAVDAMISHFKPTHVVHLAAQSSVGNAAQTSDLTWRTNFLASYNLAYSLSRQNSLSVFFFSSTVEVYGTSFQAGPASEMTAPQPGNAYAASKLAAEHMLSDILPKDCHLLIARAVNHTGAGQDARFVLPSFAKQIAEIEAFRGPRDILVGNLEAERDFLHVDDVIAAYMLLIERAAELPNRILTNIGSGKTWKISKLLDMLMAQSHQPLRIVQDPSRLRASDIPIARLECAEISRLTGWAPAREMPDVLHEVLSAAREKVIAT